HHPLTVLTALCFHHFFFLTTQPPPRSTLFPYTTLFRSYETGREAVTPKSRVAPRGLHRLEVVGRRLRRELEPRGARFSDRLRGRSEEHTSELQSRFDLVCRLLLEKKK